MADADTSICLMEKSLQRVFCDDARRHLFGAGPERALDVYRRFVVPGSGPGVYLEFPLGGSPSYDVLVGPYGDDIAPGTHLSPANPPACRAAWDWASTSRTDPGMDLLFELDAWGPKDQHAGIHFRHMGNLRAADSFLHAMGEGWRSQQYLDVVGRLPEGWDPLFVAVFFGRPGAPTRLELYPSRREMTRIVREPDYLATCLDRIGFEVYDGRMLDNVRAIVAFGRPVAFQFDILVGGSLGNTFSVEPFFEGTGKDFGALYAEAGVIGRVCGALEYMGFADDRWRLVEKLLFADKRVENLGGEQRWVSSISMPICAKAKWIDTKPLSAKFYVSLKHVVGERWSLLSWVNRR